MIEETRNKLTPLPGGNTQVSGYVGSKLDAVLRSRILSQHAREEILGEATDALRQRVDDRLRPGSGLWQGEFWGKWILSAVAAQRYTGSNSLQATIRSSIEEVLKTQDPDGYIGTYSDSLFVRSNDTGINWNIWCRKYTLWGLVEAYELFGETRWLETAVRFMDHLSSQVGPRAIPIIETGQFCGLPSTSILLPVVRLYRISGESRFLDYAHYIVDQWAANRGQPPDIVNKGLEGQPIHQWFPNPQIWAKAYEFISCVEGLLELYRVDPRSEWLDCAVSIHRLLRKYERTVFGGIGKNDKLLATRYLLETESEICDAVYWQRLSTQLLTLTGEAVYANEIERTLYNVLCGAMNAEGTWGLRRHCLSGEHWVAPKHCALSHHQCCVANLPRGLLQAIQCAVMSRSDGLAIVLFIPGRFRARSPAGQQLTVTIKTDYPRSGKVWATVGISSPEQLIIAIRVPEWSERTTLQADGCVLPRPAPDTFAELDRIWRNGDVLECEFDVRVRAEPLPSLEGHDSTYAALTRGPVVLARDIRLGEPDVDAPVAIDQAQAHSIAVTETKVAAEIWQAYRTESGVTPAITLCDYSSAGQTWNRNTSAFRVWLQLRTPMEKAEPSLGGDA